MKKRHLQIQHGFTLPRMATCTPRIENTPRKSLIPEPRRHTSPQRRSSRRAIANQELNISAPVLVVISILILGVSMSAEAGLLGFGGDSWEEEVLLHDGSKIIAERAARRAFSIESAVSVPFATPTPTFPALLPTTTVARKLKRRPPATTRATLRRSTRR